MAHPGALFLAIVVSVFAVPAVAAECAPFDHGHAAWDAILRRAVADGRVDYSLIRREERDALRGYTARLSQTCAADYETWSREQRLAFWINAYNAFTVELILRHYPIASIRKIGWLPGAAFREEFIPMPGLKGSDISLNDIEHGTLRADFAEPRIHFALVCASVSCPPLRGEAYRAAQLETQLEDQARAFLGDASKNRFVVATGTLYLSRIFDWFAADFEAAAGSVPGYVARYMSLPAAAQDVEVEFLDYDWSLNDAAAR